MSRGSPMRCPVCESPGRTRSSVEVSKLARDVYIDCTNNECGHRWKAQLSFVYSINKPITPTDSISLPEQPRRYRRGNRDGDPPPVAVPA